MSGQLIRFFSDLESVAIVVEGSDLSNTEDPFEPTVKCINDTKKKQLVTRSGLQKPRCCVCHLRLVLFDNFPKQYFKQEHVIAGDANAAAYKYHKKQEYQDVYNSSVAVMQRERQREVNNGRPFESRLHIHNGCSIFIGVS